MVFCRWVGADKFCRWVGADKMIHKSLLKICFLLFICSTVVVGINPIFENEPDSSPQRELSEMLFGDIQLNKRQKSALQNKENMGSSSSSNSFGAVEGINLRWTNAVIPYEIDCSLENLENAVDAITKAMAEWEAKTCIRFVKRTNEKYFLQFFRNTHCWGNVGMTSYTKISVGHGCEYQHVMTHEIGHVVGFYHEQNRKDRDQFVKVHWENIGQFKDAFDIVKNTDSLGVPYDYSSIMHYPWTAFSSNGKKTMTPIQPLNGKTPYVALSKADAEQTSLMYNCSAVLKKREKARNKRHIGEFTFSKRNVNNDCIDKNQHCADWSKAGQCSLSSYVHENCKKSCGSPSCHGNTKEVIISSNCVDQRNECPEWARIGHCALAPSVKQACPKSCNSCKGNTGGGGGGGGNNGGGSNCVDQRSECPEWARLGHCAINPSVKQACPKSCNSCGGNSGGGGSGGDCVDAVGDCPDWAAMGHCELNPSVKKACKKSCNSQCDVNKKCKDGDDDCGDWAKAGHCVTNPTVQKLCERSCDLCNGRPTYPPTQRPNPTLTAPTSRPVFRRYLGTGRLCADRDDRCPYWASIGECQRVAQWMNRKCSVSCNITTCDNGVQKPPVSCATPLGLADDGSGKFKIPDSAFTSRTSFRPGGGWVASAADARLYKIDDHDKKRIGSWCSNSFQDAKSDFLQVDLGKEKTITHIATQGRDKYFERISKFKIAHSNDGVNFKTYQQDGGEKVFDGNCDHITPVLNRFRQPMRARYIRYYPVEYNFACLRMELYGC